MRKCFPFSDHAQEGRQQLQTQVRATLAAIFPRRFTRGTPHPPRLALRERPMRNERNICCEAEGRGKGSGKRGRRERREKRLRRGKRRKKKKKRNSGSGRGEWDGEVERRVGRSHLPTYLTTHPPTYLPTYLTTHPPPYLTTHLPTYLPTTPPGDTGRLSRLPSSDGRFRRPLQIK